MNDRERESLEALSDRLYDNRLSAEEERRLAVALADPNNRAFFVEAMTFQTALRKAGMANSASGWSEKKNRKVRRRMAMWPPLAAAAGLLAALGIGLWLSQTSFDLPAPQGIVARAESAQGSVFGVMDDVPERRALKAGDSILAGMRIETGKDGSVALAWLDNTARLALAGNSKLETRNGKPVFLQQGALTATVAPQPADRRFAVETPNARAVVIGTRFELVAATDLTRLTVAEGEIELTDLARDVSVRVSAGLGSVVTPRAPPSVFPMGTTDGLLALYLFNESRGTTVFDVSGIGTPVNLTIGNPENTEWRTNSLRVTGSANIRSGGDAEKIRRAMLNNGALTTEAWLRSDWRETGSHRMLLYKWRFENELSLTVSYLDQYAHVPVSELHRHLKHTIKTQQYGTAFLDDKRASSVVNLFVDGAYTMTTTAGKPNFFASQAARRRAPEYVLAPTPDAYELQQGVQKWSGELLAVALYGRELSASEIRENYETGRRRYDTSPGPVE